MKNDNRNPEIGLITCSDCWDALAKEKNSHLIDIRRSNEWSLSGIPDISKLQKKVMLASIMLDDTGYDELFLNVLRSRISAKGDTLFFICRSGGRSLVAAKLANAIGYKHSFNVIGGFDFENPDSTIKSWKDSGLPWEKLPKISG